MAAAQLYIVMKDHRQNNPLQRMVLNRSRLAEGNKDAIANLPTEEISYLLKGLTLV